jgi:hypothetical protein
MYCKAEIEHYRPKKGVDEDANHNGYYWLCYEWSNLVPSCRYCNTEGGKGNKFPIIANRISTPDLLPSGKPNTTAYRASSHPLISEQPYLLHPEIDEPKNFLIFEHDSAKTGIKINGSDYLNRGNETIRICNLNRPYVKLDRMQAVLYPLVVAIDKVFEYIEQDILDIENIGKALALHFKQVEEEANAEQLTHTLLRWYIINDAQSFETIVSPLINNLSQREVVMEAFKNYRAGEN